MSPKRKDTQFRKRTHFECSGLAFVEIIPITTIMATVEQICVAFAGKKNQLNLIIVLHTECAFYFYIFLLKRYDIKILLQFNARRLSAIITIAH